MKKVFFMLLLIVSGVVCMNAQVTIGSDIKPTKGALLELKTQQADVDNATATKGGLVLPRVKLVDPATLEPFVELTDPDWLDPTEQAKLTRNVIGLLIYNVGTGNGLTEGILIWTGAKWEMVGMTHPWVNPTSSTLKHATHEDDVIATVAQVTVGLGESSVGGSLLQVKDILNVTDDGPNATKGIVLPRVKLSSKDELYPMYLTNPRLDYHATTNNGSPEYLANKAALKKVHAGLIVYNTDETGDGLCYGLNQWDGKEWNCFQTKMGNAKFNPVSCTDITVYGSYVENAEVTSGNYLVINVNVIRAGSYSIVVKSRRNSTGPGNGAGNGYNYYLSGVALEAGPLTLIVPCQGKPSYVTEAPLASNSDDLVIEGLGDEIVCPHKVTVVTSVSTYALNCASIAVNGLYVKGTPLSASNTITLNVMVSSPGSYSFTTPLTNGIRFSANDNFATAGMQSVTLIGSGSPTQNIDFPIEINANTPEGNNKCSAVIPMTLPALTYAIIGSGDYSWQTTIRKAAFNGASFGPTNTAKVRIVSLTELWSTTNVATAAGYLSGSGANSKPDIVLYFAYGAQATSALAIALRTYVNNGGVLIYGTADNTASAANYMLDGIFGTDYQNAVNRNASSNQNVFQINNLPDDPIINGPFGNLGGRFWGEDNSGSVYVTSLPPNSVQICSMNNQYSNTSMNLDYSIVWYNNSKNFVYFGDCVAATTTSTSTTGWPALYSTSGLPLSKSFGYWNSSTAGTVSVQNAALELNAVAWAIKKAAVSGINPH